MTAPDDSTLHRADPETTRGATSSDLMTEHAGAERASSAHSTPVHSTTDLPNAARASAECTTPARSLAAHSLTAHSLADRSNVDRSSVDPSTVARPTIDLAEVECATSEIANGEIAPAAALRVATRRASALNASVPVARPGEFAPLSIGRLRVFPPVVLAPMAGVTNYPFRSLCREFGAGLYVSEMITARGYLNGNRLTCLLASSSPDEKPRSVQIYGSDPVDVGEMAKCLVADGVDHLDMNFGCPVPKVTRHGGGSAIPLKPRLLARIVRAAVRSAGDVPVTIKVRIGIDATLATFLDAGRVAESEGAAAIGLHARTAAQLYAGEASWSAIGELKQSVSIPVLGNGDIWECWDALRMMRASGCDGVIVGRGCLGRPWLFAELAGVFDGREPETPPDLGAIIAIMHDHARRLIRFFGEEHGMRQMRKWCGWYTKGFRGSAAVRERLSRVSTLADMTTALASLDASEPFPHAALRANRAKGGREQRVALPHGYLDDRDDDTPPRSPHSTDEIEAWERALSGG